MTTYGQRLAEAKFLKWFDNSGYNNAFGRSFVSFSQTRKGKIRKAQPQDYYAARIIWSKMPQHLQNNCVHEYADLMEKQTIAL